MPFNMLTEKATAGMVAGLLALALIIGSPLPCQAVDIVKNGHAAAVIVTGPQPSQESRLAARQLAHYIHLVTGAQLQIKSSAPPSQARILVGPSACPTAIRSRLRHLSRGGYLIESSGDRVVLAGNGRNGTFFAVYKFLERSVGVRWLWPGKSGEVIPRKDTIAVGRVSMEREPAYVWRNLGPGGPLWGGMDKWTAQRKLEISARHQQLEKLWEIHNGFGGVRIYGGHAWGKMIPPAKYGPTHPEYFALVNGKRQWHHFDGKHGDQLDTTNPEVIRLAADYVDRFFNSHPGYDAVSISPNDGGGFCQCQKCLRLDSGRYENGHRVITDRIITFANQVADLVARRYPSKKLILFAYGPYRLPPVHVKPRPNLIIQYTFHASEDWNRQAADRQFQATGAWSGVARNLAIYEYFIQGDFPDLPRLMLVPIQRSVESLHQQGYRYYQTQSGDGYAINGLNYYVLARLLWTPALNVHAIVRDYSERGFGKAAPEVERYFNRLENQWKAQKGRSVGMGSGTLPAYERVAAAYPPAFLAACRYDLQKAYSLAQGEDRKRVEFLEKGLDYVSLTLDAVNRTILLLKGGWRLTPRLSAPPNPNMEDFESALRAWRERNRYVEGLKQDFVISYFWIRYNDRHSFVPTRKMEEYAKAHHLPLSLR